MSFILKPKSAGHGASGPWTQMRELKYDGLSMELPRDTNVALLTDRQTDGQSQLKPWSFSCTVTYALWVFGASAAAVSQYEKNASMMSVRLCTLWNAMVWRGVLQNSSCGPFSLPLGQQRTCFDIPNHLSVQYKVRARIWNFYFAWRLEVTSLA